MPSLEEQGGRSLSSPEQLLAHLLYDTHRDKLWAGVEYRQRILRRWKIAAGSSVLEIGCGQGEFTAPHRTDQPTNLQPFIPCAVTLHLATTFDNYRNPCSASQVFVNRSMS
jgi:hypothetical protein